MFSANRLKLVKHRLQGFSVSSCSSHGGGPHHGLRRTKVGAWMPRTVGVVLAHQGVGHLHNLMGEAGENVKQNKIKYI